MIYTHTPTTLREPWWWEIGGARAIAGDEGKDVVRQLLRKDPATRPAANDVMEHPWFQSQLGAELVTLRRLLDKKISPQVVVAQKSS